MNPDRALAVHPTVLRSIPVHGSLPVKVFLLLCLTALATPLYASSAVISPSTPAAADDLKALGYRASWSRRTRERALRASRENEPYLANRLFREIAELGDGDAAFRLGLYYDVAVGPDHDPVLAVSWYRRAAALGEIHALHNLGVAYANGNGVEMNIKQAIKWWTQAALRGNPDSQYNLGILYTAGDFGIAKNIERAKHWWRKAARHGDAMAQYNLGTLYVNSGVRDYCKAWHWWKEAARNGVEQAGLALRFINIRQDFRTCQ